MRSPRIKPLLPTVFHTISRLVPEVPYLKPHEKEYFRQRLRRLARFLDMTLLTYAIMGNHFHVLSRSPDRSRRPLSNEQLLKKLRRYYGPRSQQVQQFQDALDRHTPGLASLRERYLARLGDVSVFMKELKEGFSRWYNRRHDRHGTLWSQRFKSPTIGQDASTIMTMAAYIDLNAVRAGLVHDPKDYRFCGYTEAVAGDKETRAGMRAFLPPGTWKVQMAEYRKYLYGTAWHPNQAQKRALSPKEIAKVMKARGKLSVAQALRVRVRYFSDGAVIGTRQFVEDYWRKYLKKPGSKRQSGARKMKGAEWGELRVLRDLQKDVMG